ncbi:hypothetical protein B0J18DRAFT_418496 [Chaetomium sp. MPI-SDFR-AT-0129]|nr:hypothetical protein B0J18DRAFT_418496 [Chaetomium sp. MPI-SDFR-AT-0129]
MVLLGLVLVLWIWRGFLKSGGWIWRLIWRLALMRRLLVALRRSRAWWCWLGQSSKRRLSRWRLWREMERGIDRGEGGGGGRVCGCGGFDDCGIAGGGYLCDRGPRVRGRRSRRILASWCLIIEDFGFVLFFRFGFGGEKRDDGVGEIGRMISLLDNRHQTL